MDTALERLFPASEERADAMRILQVLFDAPDKVLRGEDVLARASVSLMQGLVILARLTHEGLIQHPSPGTYSVGRAARLNAS